VEWEGRKGESRRDDRGAERKEVRIGERRGAKR